jgi:CheY-like chemotaxis protein
MLSPITPLTIRILFNGLTNAIKFTDTGHILLTLLSTTDNGSIVCTIQDTGKGISPAFRLDMFEPFTKADPFAPGAGLGLYIVRTLASRMGGNIALEPAKGGGTLFTASLPVILLGARPVTPKIARQVVDARQNGHERHEADVTDAGVQLANTLKVDSHCKEKNGAVAVQQPIADQQPAGETPRILVVDDNEIGRRILVKLLKQISRHYPIDYREAKDGLEAIEIFKVYNPHVVLTDVSMPRMDGITSASEMRQIEYTTTKMRSKIYAITGLGSSDPRLTTDALHGSAELDGWLIKGEAKLAEIREIIDSVKLGLSGGLPP